MTKIRNANSGKMIIFLVTVIFSLFSLSYCKSGIDPIVPNDPNDPTPDELVKPVISIGTATNVTATTATLVAWLIPNETDTKFSFEYKTSTSV